jgi:hypothetical protein
VGGVDWDLRAPDGVHRFRGQLAASQAWNPTDQNHAGQALYLEASRAEDPAWIWALRARVYSHSFDPNGLGYLERPDLMSLVFDTTLRTPRPLGPYRRISVNPWVWRDTNTAGLVINQGAGLECALTFRNLWQVGAGGTGTTERYDDRETRGGMPYLLTPSATGWAWVTTDERAPVRGTLYYSMLTQNGGHQANASLSLAWTPATFVTLSASGNARAVFDVPRWVANQTGVGGALTSVFGRQNAQIFDTSVRAAVAFSRRITLDVFSQLLVGSLRYDQYSTLVRPDQLMPTAYGPDASYDEVALTVNAIARYEYLRGSFFTLVFLHRAYVSAARGAENFGHGLGLLADGQPDDLLMAKMTYLVL